ncbi:hypothetical protein ACGFW5_31570 [Streptomyces sp. NPDC048416]|uniref:hypothetical protein n=1 Tax=Streptomyces sp. NPDC048416 TaxID=3365546 RepID=UPI003720622A
MITATRLEPATAAVTVLSNRREVTDWAQRYFGPWWNAAPVEPTAVSAEGVVIADVDPGEHDTITRLVFDGRLNVSVDFAKHRLRAARDGDDVIATSASEGVAYRSSPANGRFVMATMEDVQPLALAAARVAREAIRGQLLRAGWAVLHASAVVRPRDGATILTFGDKGAGKTTTALLLASHGWELLANDRVLVRPTEQGVEVVPWPSAAALGLGLLHSLGWDVIAREHLRAGGSFHPTQHEAVTTSLMRGSSEPLWESARRERKVQVFPDQFPKLFGVPLATSGRAAAVLFPEMDPSGVPDVLDEPRSLGEADFMSGSTEDRYPDLFDQWHGIEGGGRESVRHVVGTRLAALPHRAVRLTHDIPASTAVLAKVTDSI